MKAILTAADVIRLLDLKPHPEGGHFRETFRDASLVFPVAQRVTLGSDLTAGERPQAVVPAHAWQAAETLGEWTLVGCTVAPGFDFAQFELAPKGWEPQ